MIPEAVPGYMASHELAVVCALASSLPEKGTWVEVGSYGGKSLLAAYKGLHPSCKLVAIDDLRGVDGPVPPEALTSLSKVVAHTNAKFLSLPSMEVAKQFRDGSVDAVFIDGSHDYESVKADILVWSPKLTPRGFLCGHNYHIASVRKAVDELLTPTIIHATTIWKSKKNS